MSVILISIVIVIAFFGLCYIVSSIQNKRREAELNAALSPVSAKVEEKVAEKADEANNIGGEVGGCAGCLVGLVFLGFIGTMVYIFAMNFFDHEEFLPCARTSSDTVMVMKHSELNDGPVDVTVELKDDNVICNSKYSDGTVKSDTIDRTLYVNSNWERTE